MIEDSLDSDLLDRNLYGGNMRDEALHEGKLQDWDLYDEDSHDEVRKTFKLKRREKMVRHVIVWKLKEEFSPEEKEKIKAEIKAGLEALAGRIPGLLRIRVYTQGLPSSTSDLMLDSEFESVEALKAYSVHPEHVAVANGKVRPNVAVRSCFDVEVPTGR